jgi:hypothetical protein
MKITKRSLPGPPGFEKWYDSVDAITGEDDNDDPLWNGGSNDGTFVTCKHCEDYNAAGNGHFGKDGDVLLACDGCDGLLNWTPKIGWAAHCEHAPVRDGDPPWGEAGQ